MLRLHSRNHPYHLHPFTFVNQEAASGKSPGDTSDSGMVCVVDFRTYSSVRGHHHAGGGAD
ncbi:MAG: hypothetical protein K2J15_06855, partial [Muribaculaceae bacterium]|nr:hypothetical protein [Muribaculaceae bacterium]